MVNLLVLVAVAIAAGALAAAMARRWPVAVEAPRVTPSMVVRTVAGHRRLVGFLRRRVDPATLTGLALTVALVTIAAAVIGVGALLAMVRTDTGFARLDGHLAQIGAEQASDTSTAILRAISRLGGYEVVFGLGAAVAAVEWRRTHDRAVFAFVALAFGGQFLAAEFIKLIVDRSRPDVLQLTGYAGGSFPSGHAVAGAAVFLAAALLLSRGRSRPVRSYLIGAAVGVAVAVAGTRVLLGVHWFTDVFAGLLVGWAWFALCSIAFGGRPLRFGAPVAQAEAVAASPSFGPARP